MNSKAVTSGQKFCYSEKMQENFSIMPKIKERLGDLPEVNLVAQGRKLVNHNQILAGYDIYHQGKKVGIIMLAVDFDQDISHKFETVPLSSGSAVIDNIFIDENERQKHLGLAIYVKLLTILGFGTLKSGTAIHPAIHRIWQRLVDLGIANNKAGKMMTDPEKYLDF